MLRGAVRASWTLGDRGSIYCEIERAGFAQLRPVYSCWQWEDGDVQRRPKELTLTLVSEH